MTPNCWVHFVLKDNCTNLVAGESCQQTCAQGFLPASGSSAIHFACDLQGNINISGSMPQCEHLGGQLLGPTMSPKIGAIEPILLELYD